MFRSTAAIVLVMFFFAFVRTFAADHPNRMTIICDAFGKSDKLIKDWGFSALLEYDGQRILFDCGNDATKFAANVEVLKVNLKSIDKVVISHRHGDHTAGLAHVLKTNAAVTVYTPLDEPFNAATPKGFYKPGVASLPSHMRYFDGAEPDLVPHGNMWHGKTLMVVKEIKEIARGIFLIPTISEAKGSLEMPELSLAVKTENGLIVVTGCSHCGIEKVLEAATKLDRRIRFLAGGLHLVTNGAQDIDRVTANLRGNWNVQAIAPGHCTSERGFLTLQQLFGDRYVYAGVGEVFELP